MPWSSEDFMVRYLEAIEAQPHSDPDGSELEGRFTSSAQHLVQEQISDLGFSLADRRAYAAGFRIRLQARWGEALDLFELLMNECTDIGGEVNEQFRPRAVELQDHRFEALMRLHGKASLTTSEILTLLETGHAMGAMARWRTLHDVNVMSAFLAENDDDLSYRYLRHQDYQTLKIRRSYDTYAGRLGYEPMTTEADGDPDELRESLVDEFGSSFLERNGWAAPAFGGRPPKDADFELKAGLDHMRPYVYLASDGVHATPKGLMSTLQHLGEDPIIMAGPSNAGLADPGTEQPFLSCRSRRPWPPTAGGSC